MPEVAELVTSALDGARPPALIVSDHAVAAAVAGATTVIDTWTVKPEGHFRTVLLAVTDLEELREVVRRLPPLGWARVVCVVVTDHDRVLTLRADPLWPPPADVEARTGWTRIAFAERTEALPVLRAFAHGVAPGGTRGHGGLRVGRPGAAHEDAATTVPPDVVVDPPSPPVVSEATGRSPAVVASARAEASGTAVDEAVYNPTGFCREWTRPVVDLPATTPLTPALVRGLRDAQGVRVAPGGEQRLLVGLAMSGVPLVSADWSALDLEDLHDVLLREELSVRQRRGALVEHSLLARRHRLAETARVRTVGFASVTVLLTLTRPDRLAHALAQVTRQRRALPGAELELVITADGFVPDPDVVDAATELGGVPTTISPPGDAARAAGGDVVLLLADDTFYGPDVVTDLLLARHHSGADVVGVADTLLHLGADDATVLLGGPSEDHDAGVSPGTLLLDRALLRELAPAGRVDPVEVRRAGGSVYRAHGLGHLRRVGPGHPVPGPVLARWDGFRPSSLLRDS